MPYLAHADRLPPFLCRLIARKKHGRELYTTTELAQRSGLARSTISDLSRRASWAGVTIDVLDKFSAACGVDHFHLQRHLKHLRRGKLMGTKSGTRTQLRMVLRLQQLANGQKLE